MADALAHHAVVGRNAQLGKPRELRPQTLFGVKVLELGRPARLVFELLRTIAFEEQEPARLERLRQRKTRRASSWHHLG